MANKKYIVELTSDERAQLTAMIKKGKSSAQANLKARILLKADQGEAGEGWLDERICDALDTNATMASRRRPKDTWAVNVVSVGSVWQWPAVRGVANRFPPEFFSVP